MKNKLATLAAIAAAAHLSMSRASFAQDLPPEPTQTEIDAKTKALVDVDHPRIVPGAALCVFRAKPGNGTTLNEVDVAFDPTVVGFYDLKNSKYNETALKTGEAMFGFSRYTMKSGPDWALPGHLTDEPMNDVLLDLDMYRFMRGITAELKAKCDAALQL